MNQGYFDSRFAFDPRRAIVWKTLCQAYFQKLVTPTACVLELGPGYGDFINNIRCARRIAVDSREATVDCLDPGVFFRVGSVTDLSFIEDDTIDFAFASNLFEHLTQDEFATTLAQLREKIRSGGTLNILQPNYRLAYPYYFDDYTHISVYSDRSLCDFLQSHGFRVIQCLPRFLPFSIRTRFPVWPMLIHLYLLLPFKPFAGQMFIRSTPH
jgi:hypothetical protein